MEKVICIETGAVGTATLSIPLFSRAICMLSLRSSIVTWCLCHDQPFEILAPIYSNKWFQDACICKLPKFHLEQNLFSEPDSNWKKNKLL